MSRYTSLVLLILVSFSMALFRKRFQCDENGVENVETIWPEELTQQECDDAEYDDTCDDQPTATNWLFTCVDEFPTLDPINTDGTGTYFKAEYSAAGCNEADMREIDYPHFVSYDIGTCNADDRLGIDMEAWCDDD